MTPARFRTMLATVEAVRQTREGSTDDPPPRVIGRQLAMGFGLIAAIATLMCAMLLATIHEVSGVVEQMRQDEAAIRLGAELSAAAREQYIHIAHSLIEGDRSHLDHYVEWKSQVERDARAMAEHVPPDVRPRLQSILDLSDEMDEIFREVLLPAAEQGDLAELRGQHKRVERLSFRAASEADAIAVIGQTRMAEAHEVARRAGIRGSALGFGCVAAVLLVAVASTYRLRAAVLQPLAALTRAAARFGRGDFEHRVGDLGRGELRALSRAFDRMAEELAVREHELLRKERMAAIGRLAAGIAHEINNPIGIIRGYIKTMIPGAADAEVREELEILDEEAAACQRLTGDLLTFAETPRLEPRRIEMGAFLDESVARLREVADPGGQVLVVDAHAGAIDADPARLRQVLANLVRNATQASPGGASIHIWGRPTPEDGYELTVTDSGTGVAPEDRAQIFEPFFSRRSGGSGLGLAVSRTIVDVHGGTISLEAGPQGGARFRVELPRRPPPPKRSELA